MLIPYSTNSLFYCTKEFETYPLNSKKIQIPLSPFKRFIAHATWQKHKYLCKRITLYLITFHLIERRGGTQDRKAERHKERNLHPLVHSPTVRNQPCQSQESRTLCKPHTRVTRTQVLEVVCVAFQGCKTAGSWIRSGTRLEPGILMWDV